jgi:sugar phosphate isomerase/epimerase
MKLGLGSIVYEFAGVPLLEQAARITAHGIRYVDILAFGQFNPAFYTKEHQSRVAETFKRHNLIASSIVTCADGNIGSLDKDERLYALDQWKRAGLLLKTLGGKQVLIGKGCGNIDFYLSRETAADNSAALLADYCDWCFNEGLLVTLELEPEALYVLNGTQAMADMLARLNRPNVYANIDIGHLNILREPPESLDKLKGRIIHMHISDNVGLAHTNSVIGEGNANIRAYIHKAVELGIDQTAEDAGDIAVAGIEVGEPGEYITDSDNRVLRSVGNVCLRVPELREN